jgi:hypothetical protein
VWRDVHLTRRIPDLKLDRLAFKLNGADFLRGGGQRPVSLTSLPAQQTNLGPQPGQKQATRSLYRSVAALTKSTPIVLM